MMKKRGKISTLDDNINETAHEGQAANRIPVMKKGSKRSSTNSSKMDNDPGKGLITQVQRNGLPKNGNGAPTIDEYLIHNGFKNPDADSILPPQADHNRGKKTLVLDLDETLVHSSFKPVENSDIVLPVEIEDKVYNVYVLKRPGTDEFLNRMYEIYEVVIYTASLSKYAAPLLEILDPDRRIAARLYRESCTFYNGSYIKDLTQLGRDLKDIIIVDNSPISYSFQPENAIPIISWFDDLDDCELYDFIPVFEALAKVHDVSRILQKLIDEEITTAGVNQYTAKEMTPVIFREIMRLREIQKKDRINMLRAETNMLNRHEMSHESPLQKGSATVSINGHIRKTKAGGIKKSNKPSLTINVNESQTTTSNATPTNATMNSSSKSTPKNITRKSYTPNQGMLRKPPDRPFYISVLNIILEGYI